MCNDINELRRSHGVASEELIKKDNIDGKPILYAIGLNLSPGTLCWK